MTDELKPCPFCGGENVETSYKDTFNGDFRRGVYCADCCGGIYPYYDTKTEAIDAWNTRAERTTPMYRDNHGIWHCENCEHGADRLTGSDGALDAWADSWAPNYCPNCGAKVVDE